MTLVTHRHKHENLTLFHVRLAQPVAVQRVEDGAVPARPVREHERDLQRVRQRISTERAPQRPPLAFLVAQARRVKSRTLPSQRKPQLCDLNSRQRLRSGDVREQLAAEVLVGGLEDEPIDDSAHALCPEGCCASLRNIASVPDGPLDHGKELLTLGSWLTGLHLAAEGSPLVKQQSCCEGQPYREATIDAGSQRHTWLARRALRRRTHLDELPAHFLLPDLRSAEPARPRTPSIDGPLRPHLHAIAAKKKVVFS